MPELDGTEFDTVLALAVEVVVDSPATHSLAHELRSPLNSIQGWAHVLEGRLDGADAEVRRALAGIATGIEQQVRLIEGLEARPPR